MVFFLNFLKFFLLLSLLLFCFLAIFSPVVFAEDVERVLSDNVSLNSDVLVDDINRSSDENGYSIVGYGFNGSIYSNPSYEGNVYVVLTNFGEPLVGVPVEFLIDNNSYWVNTDVNGIADIVYSGCDKLTIDEGDEIFVNVPNLDLKSYFFVQNFNKKFVFDNFFIKNVGDNYCILFK